MIPRRSAVLLGIVVLFTGSIALSSTASDWTMSRYDQGLTGFTEEKLDLPLSLSWQYNVTGVSRVKRNPSTPAVFNGTVYFASGERLFAVDAETGALKWQYPAEEKLPGAIKTSVTEADGLILFGCNDGNLYAIDSNTGKYVWHFATGVAIRSTPIVSPDGTVFFGSDDDCLHAVNLETGVEIWKSGFRTKDDVAATPALGQGLVVFASKDTNIYAANQLTGNTRWIFRLPNSMSNIPPVIADGCVYLAAGNMLDVLTLGSGTLRNTVRLPADMTTAPTIANKQLFVTCSDKKLYCFEIIGKNIKPKWAQPADLSVNALGSATVAGDTIYVPCAQGIISAYSTEDGLLKWRYIMTPSKAGPAMDTTDAASSPVVADGALYALTDDGALHCFKPGGADDTSPEIANVDPQIGSAMSGTPPIPVSATIYDIGSGIDESSIQLSLDGTPVEQKFDITKSKVTYQTPVTKPIRSLKDGPHTLTLSVKDWKGNKTESSWTFMVDNTMRPRVTPKASTTDDKSKTGQTGQTDPNSRRGSRRGFPGGPGLFPGTFPGSRGGRPVPGAPGGGTYDGTPPPPPVPGGAVPGGPGVPPAPAIPGP